MPISNAYIRGLVDGEGCFTFHSSRRILKSGTIVREKIPAFAIAMHERDKILLFMIKRYLDLSCNINVSGPYNKDGSNRGKKAVLTVRRFGELKNIIIPLFYQGLNGYKKQQFFDWLEKIGADPEVREDYKLLHRLYKTGYYERELKPGGFFAEFLN